MGDTSIIKIGPSLIVSFSDDINDADALGLQEAITGRLEETGSTGVLLDISGLETVDSFLGRLLNDIAQGARLLGARTVISGMQPAVAMTLVELGLQLNGVRTALDAEAGLRLLGIDVGSDNGR